MKLLKLLTVLKHEQEKARARNENPPRYIVRTLADLADIPKDRLPAFMEELTLFAALLRAKKEETPNKVAFLTDSFTWVDDGINAHVLMLEPVKEA